MNKWIASALAGIVMTGATTVAEARTKTFVIDGSDFAVGQQDRMSAFGVTMPDGSSTSFQFGFTLPANYKKNSPIKVTLKGYSDLGSCGIRIVVANVFRLRTGAEFSNDFGATGVMADQTIAIPAGTSRVVSKTFTLFKSTTGPVFDQKPGDKVVIGMERIFFHDDDTCAGNFTAVSAKITYTVK